MHVRKHFMPGVIWRSKSCPRMVKPNLNSLAVSQPCRLSPQWLICKTLVYKNSTLTLFQAPNISSNYFHIESILTKRQTNMKYSKPQYDKPTEFKVELAVILNLLQFERKYKCQAAQTVLTSRGSLRGCDCLRLTLMGHQHHNNSRRMVTS